MLKWLTQRLLGSASMAGEMRLDAEQRLALPPRSLQPPRPFTSERPRFGRDGEPVSRVRTLRTVATTRDRA